MKTWKLASLAGALGLSVAAHATFYTSESSFLAAINAAYYLEDFNSFTNGVDLAGDPSWNAPGANGYSWTVSAPPGGLWSLDGALSTLDSDEAINFNFTGAPVSAFACVVGNTDIDGVNQGGLVTFTMSNGDSLDVNDGSFIGWVGDNAVTSASVFAHDSGAGTDWAAVDHVYTGAKAGTVPEPASMTVLALGGLALLRRRKRA